MPESQNHFRLTNRPLTDGHDEEPLRLARKLEVYRDPEQLMHALPAELFDLFRGNSQIVAFCVGSEVTSWLAIGSKRHAMEPTLKGLDAQKSLHAWIEERRKPFILSSLKEQNPFPQLTDFFQEIGNQSFCVFPFNTATRCIGAICIGRTQPDAFSEREVGFFSLISDFVALAVDDRMMRVQLEGERTKLRLILDLNNSVVANLKLRDVLQSILAILTSTCRRHDIDPQIYLTQLPAEGTMESLPVGSRAGSPK
jgi:formate hydrogenlyase transcriptional activator